MTDVPIGIVNTQTTTNGFKMVDAAEDNYNGVRDINEASVDRYFKPVYWTGVPTSSNPGDHYYTPDYAEIKAGPWDNTITDLVNPRPKHVDWSGMPESISVSVGGGYGPISASVSYTFSTGHSTGFVDGPDNHPYGYSWKIDATGSDNTYEWPTGPANPDPDTVIDNVPTVKWGVSPDAKSSSTPDTRLVWTESRYHYTNHRLVSNRYWVPFSKTTDKNTSHQSYTVVK